MTNSPQKTLYYITRDIERALGAIPSPTYRIITNRTPYGETIQKLYPEFITLINSPDGRSLGTGALMEHPETIKIVPPGSNVLVFKNTARIEPLAASHGWHLINPKASLSETVENKISQVEWLGDLGKKYLPHHVIMLAKNITWTKEPFILQWAHGHTGDGTVIINSPAELKSLQQKFPDRVTRRTTYVRGPSFTVNAVVASNKILVGNISYQITGLPPFTDNAFTTVGNDWGLTHSLLNEVEIEYIENMVSDIGKKLNIAGWRGLFGVDIIRDDEHNTIYMIEINARQPASTTFESHLQNDNRLAGAAGLTTFEAHLMALLNEPIEKPLIPLNDGAQIVQRVTRTIRDINNDVVGALESVEYNVITYPNTQYNTDLIRIQSPQNIMETHGKFNERGKNIEEILKIKK
jgi:hypothetical protein